MDKWSRILYQPNRPLGENGNVTCSKEHIQLSLNAAEEGMVLLKNDSGDGEPVLPLKKGCKVALFGKGSFDYVKGGGGSGDVFTKYVRNLYEGFKKDQTVSIYEPLSDFYRDYVNSCYAKHDAPGMIAEPKLSEELCQKAANYADVAIITLSRFSGEGWDRSDVEWNGEFNPWETETSMPKISAKIFPDGDFYLSEEEKAMIEQVKGSFDKIVVVLNVGGVIDTTWIKEDAKINSALLAWQGGMEGGLAMARALTGKVNPSGKLVDTFAKRLEDYPSTKHFHDSFDYVDYSEDIYVGYRYFETIPGAKENVVYPFGFGLSYTDFMLENTDIWMEDGKINLFIRVTNIGECPGKEVVQVYFEAPQGQLKKPARTLVAFKKTDLLLPGESRTLSISFTEDDMASFDDLGKISDASYVLEKGEYKLYVGTSVEDAMELYDVITVEEDRVVKKLSHKVAPELLAERMLSDGSFEALPKRTPNDPNYSVIPKLEPGTEEGIIPAQLGRDRYKLFDPFPNGRKPLMAVVEGEITMDEFVAQLSDDALIHLLGGQPNTGVANTWGFGNLPEFGVPNIMTADGPAGVRLADCCGVPTTAWPCATLLASTWNPALIEEVGAAGGAELKENNLAVWLTPAVNIHRNPMCGRNFEYYSEDPLLVGKIGSAMVRGIQSNGVSACVKHFAANNKETNRKHADSRVSERALREIYLKGFEIIVKESNPWCMMSAYNMVNGHRASENKDLLEGILREEWGYQGAVTSDWWTRGEHYKEILAGNDIKMANGYPERVKAAMELGAISREDLAHCAKRVLELIMKLD